MINFITILAWIFGCLFTVMGIISVYFSWNYDDSLDAIRDRMNGVRRVYTFKLKFIIAIICWAWIIGV